uniref:Metalloendopeptidase n=1 Tax=Caenorhabditis tropicalis TaxID=1561998 RepID=A0A1I7V087_9PELO
MRRNELLNNYLSIFITLLSLLTTYAEKDLLPPSTSSETFLTDEDFLRPLNDDETFLTEKDFKNGEKLGEDHVAAGAILWKQVFKKGDIRGKAAWKLAYHDKTCVRFVPRTAVDNDYLYIGKIDGCYSDVGRAGGRQELSLDNGCLQYDTAIHELMHSVGFYHEHERWDRDEHITILWHNIDREAYDQFGKVDLAESSYYGQLYDYYSIMHYDSLAFSKNGFETMVAKAPEMTAVIGAAIDFSPIDILKMNLMYQCSDVKLPTAIATTEKPSIPIPAPSITVVEDDCRDRTNLCWRWIDRCKSFFFEQIMKEFCALSCGYCTPKTLQTAKASPPNYSNTMLTKSSTSYLQHG